MKTKELRQKRAALIKQARDILETAETEKRALTQEEEVRWNSMLGDADKLMIQIEREERMASLESNLGQPANSNELRPVPEQDARKNYRASDEYRNAYNAYMQRGVTGLSGAQQRALQADADTLGGFLQLPMQMVNGLIKAVDNQVFIRQWATVYQVPDAASLGAPELTADPDDADWTSELATGSEDSAMNFGRRDLHPHPLGKRIKVSRKLLMKVPSVEQLVIDRLGYKFAVAQEKGFLTGSGAGQPLGVFTASTQGISTSRDVSTDNTTTAMTSDGLKNAKYTLKGQYWPRAKWMFHRDGVKQIAKIKDGEGQYIWAESVRVGEPDRLLGFPVFMSEYAPNTFTTGLYVGILGDFSQYWIADSMAMDMQRLDELYAVTNQVGFIGRLECDGLPVLEEAFVRVKLA